MAVGREQKIAGYYTLASAGIPLTDIPAEKAKKLPRYPFVPAVRMGRLAVDLSFQGQGLGSALLADAIERVVRSEIASYALMVDAIDEFSSCFFLSSSRVYRLAELAIRPLSPASKKIILCWSWESPFFTVSLLICNCICLLTQVTYLKRFSTSPSLIRRFNSLIVFLGKPVVPHRVQIPFRALK